MIAGPFSGLKTRSCRRSWLSSPKMSLRTFLERRGFPIEVASVIAQAIRQRALTDTRISSRQQEKAGFCKFTDSHDVYVEARFLLLRLTFRSLFLSFRLHFLKSVFGVPLPSRTFLVHVSEVTQLLSKRKLIWSFMNSKKLYFPIS